MFVWPLALTAAADEQVLASICVALADFPKSETMHDAAMLLQVHWASCA